MISKLKFALFGLLKKIVNYITGTGISKKIPGTLTVHDFLVRHLWPYQNVIEIQGSKMYVNVYDKDPSMRQTFQSYALCQEWEPSTTEIFKKMVKEGDTVVDLGANIGYFTLLAAKLVGKKGKVYALDKQPLAIEKIEKRARREGFSNINIISSDGTTGLPNESIDVIFLYGVLPEIEDKKSLLGELHRVLKPNGYLSTRFCFRIKRNELLEIMNATGLYLLKEQRGHIINFLKKKSKIRRQ